MSGLILGFSATVAAKLVSLQITAPAAVDTASEKSNIETEIIPAQRGIILDRNREVLTNNELTAEVQINRHAMREIDQVTYGLAYNQLIHSEKWQKETDPEKREKMLRNRRNELLENAKVKYTAEERDEIHRASLHDAKAAKLLL